ncbi:MAG: response regulator [Ferruginibacter sp.]|nr:response regulator [Ferruginibacter sp.]
MQNFPILIIEDDKDDCEFILEAISGTGIENKIYCFPSPVPALEYLRTTQEIPLLIICDINMPEMNGLAFKRIINGDPYLNAKRIPFVFLSTSAQSYLVDEAFHLCVQGYFKKPTTLNDYRILASSIIQYWLSSKLPQAVTHSN